MRELLRSLMNRNYLLTAIASTALILAYQACSQEEFVAHRLIALQSKGVLFSLEDKRFPVCSGERTLVFTYTVGLQESHTCFDNTSLAPGIAAGSLCPSGPLLAEINIQSVKPQSCKSTTICGVTPVVSEINLGTNGQPLQGLRGYRLTYYAVPLGCTGTLIVSDAKNTIVQELDVESPGTKEALCRRCSNGTYSCECPNADTVSINGLCGLSNTTISATPPTSNFCEVGEPTTVAKYGGKFLWTCLGSNGGANAYCNATNTSYIPGACGTTNRDGYAVEPTTNLCSIGTATSIKLKDNFFEWNCSGLDGGPAANCYARKITSTTLINSQCGTSNGQATERAPSASLCEQGAYTNVITNPTTFNWSCEGDNGGTTIACSAPRIIPPAD